MRNQSNPTIATERTYVLLRQSLFSLMLTNSFDKISLTDICRQAMIPRSTFYRHFEDKYALLDYCFDSLMKEAGLTLDIRIIQNRAQTREFFMALFSYLVKHKSTYKKLLNNNRLGTVLECLLVYLEKQIRISIEATFQNKIPNGIPTDMFAKILASFIFSVGKCFIECDAGYDMEELAEHLALCTDEGFLKA